MQTSNSTSDNTSEHLSTIINDIIDNINQDTNINILPTEKTDEIDEIVDESDNKSEDDNEHININENSDEEHDEHYENEDYEDEVTDEGTDEENEHYEDEGTDEENEHLEGFIPEFFLPLGMGFQNFGIFENLNNVQGIFDMMANNMLNTNASNNLINPVNQINEINPSNSGNSVLPNTTLTGQPINLNMNSVGNQEMIEEEIQKLILSGVDNLNLVSQPVLDFIDNCYLRNMQYEDDIINLIRYTVKNCFARGAEFEMKELISGIIYYSFSGINTIFSDNYDDIVLPILHGELKRIVTQSIRLAILRRTIVAPSMEDVKLVVGAEALEKIPISKYADLEDKIKSMNISCTVCQDDFNTEDTVRVLPCEHLYHPDCIDDWLKGHSYKCPCCRKPAAEYSAKI